MLFPVQRPVEDITAEWNILFFSYQKKKKKEKKKKDIATARLATISATRWTGNKLFFKGGLKIRLQISHLIFLANTMRSGLCLEIVLRVPVTVKDDDSVGSCQVQAEASRSC